MNRLRVLPVILLLCLVSIHPVASAQTAEVKAVREQIDQLRKDFDVLKQQYGDRLVALEARLAAVQGGQSAAPSPPAEAQAPAGAVGAPRPSGTLPLYGTTGASGSGAKGFNPDIPGLGD